MSSYGSLPRQVTTRYRRSPVMTRTSGSNRSCRSSVVKPPYTLRSVDHHGFPQSAARGCAVIPCLHLQCGISEKRNWEQVRENSARHSDSDARRTGRPATRSVSKTLRCPADSLPRKPVRPRQTCRIGRAHHQRGQPPSWIDGRPSARSWSRSVKPAGRRTRDAPSRHGRGSPPPRSRRRRRPPLNSSPDRSPLTCASLIAPNSGRPSVHGTFCHASAAWMLSQPAIFPTQVPRLPSNLF